MDELARIKQAMIDGEHCDGDLAWAVERIAELEQENERLRAALQDISDDPVVSEQLQMKRSIGEILAIARKGLE